LQGEFCKEVGKRSNGKVEVSYYPGGILTTAPKVITGVEQGVSDIGLSHIGYTRGRFPITETLDLPVGYTSAYVGTQVKHDFFEKFKPREWDSVHVLFLFAPGPQIFATKNNPIKKMEDLKGLKIRAAGRLASVVSNLGATPVPVPMADAYDGLNRGVVDGIVDAMETWKSFKLGELVKYATLTHKVAMAYTFYVVMNKSKWNSLPDDIKKIITEVALEWKDKTGILMNEMDGYGREFFEKNGGKVLPFSEEEGSRWLKAAEPVIEEHIKELEDKGFKRSETEKYLKFIRERVAYWTTKEKELKIPRAY
jgi:TRAP-type C4-dicarboxylate transport system substrate-binding protein